MVLVRNQCFSVLLHLVSGRLSLYPNISIIYIVGDDIRVFSNLLIIISPKLRKHQNIGAIEQYHDIISDATDIRIRIRIRKHPH